MMILLLLWIWKVKLKEVKVYMVIVKFKVRLDYLNILLLGYSCSFKLLVYF